MHDILNLIEQQLESESLLSFVGCTTGFVPEHENESITEHCYWPERRYRQWLSIRPSIPVCRTYILLEDNPAIRERFARKLLYVLKLLHKISIQLFEAQITCFDESMKQLNAGWFK